MFFAGLLLGPLWGGVALLLYVRVGIAGAPVFSNANAGLGYVIAGQGTGGFLVGFLVGAVVAGAIAHRSLAPKPVADLSVRCRSSRSPQQSPSCTLSASRGWQWSPDCRSLAPRRHARAGRGPPGRGTRIAIVQGAISPACEVSDLRYRYGDVEVVTGLR